MNMRSHGLLLISNLAEWDNTLYKLVGKTFKWATTQACTESSPFHPSLQQLVSLVTPLICWAAPVDLRSLLSQCKTCLSKAHQVWNRLRCSKDYSSLSIIKQSQDFSMVTYVWTMIQLLLSNIIYLSPYNIIYTGVRPWYWCDTAFWISLYQTDCIRRFVSH